MADMSSVAIIAILVRHFAAPAASLIHAPGITADSCRHWSLVCTLVSGQTTADDRMVSLQSVDFDGNDVQTILPTFLCHLRLSTRHHTPLPALCQRNSFFVLLLVYELYDPMPSAPVLSCHACFLILAMTRPRTDETRDPQQRRRSMWSPATRRHLNAFAASRFTRLFSYSTLCLLCTPLTVGIELCSQSSTDVSVSPTLLVTVHPRRRRHR